MNRKNELLFGFGLVFIIISVWQISFAQNGLKVMNLHTTNPPVTIITPSNASPALRATVLIAHGFAGSSVLMRGFALTLAHAGYTTVSWDFEGHAANPNPLRLSDESGDLINNVESALAQAETTGLIDSQRLAILGHSMGSGIALSYGTLYPSTQATIAISPLSQAVSPTLPHDLLLMAGSLEPQFMVNAEILLASSGGESSDFTSGTARKLLVVPNVEHISILFSPLAQSAARSWLDMTFGPQPNATNYTDHRIIWFGLGIIGFIFLSKASANLLSITETGYITLVPFGRRCIALPVGGLTATGLLYLVSLSGVRISQLLGLVVGGYILIWFGIAGSISLIIIRPDINLPNIKEIVTGLVALAALWLGVGLLGNFVWLPWLLIPQRLWLWIPGSIILLPWFYALGEVTKPAKKLAQIGWWIFQVIAVITGLYLALTLNPELGFIFIILPLVPVIFGLHMLAVSSKQGTWAFALPGAMFTAWLLLAVFPLQ